MIKLCALAIACCLLSGCSLPSVTLVTVIMPGGRNTVMYGMTNSATERTTSSAGAIPAGGGEPQTWTPLGD